MSEARARYGWESDFPEFSGADPARVREHLESYVRDASPEQLRAWRESIPPLQREVSELLVRDRLARVYGAILEYELPMEARRPDVLLLVSAGVVVVELKGKTQATQADLDQVAAYARDLRNYHVACAEREVVPVLVPTQARGYVSRIDDVHVTGPDALDTLVADLCAGRTDPPVPRAEFLRESAYRPLPTLVQAARELMQSGTIRAIHRARAATDPAVDAISRIVHQAALTRSRHLILLTGVPGAGKTLVGPRTVHAGYLDDLAVARPTGRPTAPAVFLSGNGPLVEVLQYELRAAGGDGKTFVRGVKDYVSRYSRNADLIPPEHVLVFDEAQRAFDAATMQGKHGTDHAMSEPEHFIRFASRVPEWSVVVGLIGSGQEIHVGEEGGVVQWLDAVRRAPAGTDWTIHAPPDIADAFRAEAAGAVPIESRVTLNLDVELRFHAARELHAFVADLIDDGDRSAALRARAARLEAQTFHLRLTRSLDEARAYLRQRYRDHHDARFGLVASSKDKDLVNWGVPNDYQSTKRVRFGPWYGDGESTYDGRSCRRLADCVTEFGAQGLELDATLLAWGTDFRRAGDAWSNAKARGYLKSAKVTDAMQLRRNAYRVLLTRGRDACVIFVPPIPELDETSDYLERAGFRRLHGHAEQPQ